MEKFDIYKDVAKRSGGDVYIGVVGPVRTGKSTLITKFLSLMVTPNIVNKNKRQIAIDEMPQSGQGRTITTTEPKFVPAEAVKISFKGKAQAKVRLIDCVGYLVDGAVGSVEDGKERLVKTPWSSAPMPFEKAAELGTEKVIKEHSTVAIVVTTDGTVCDIPRENYVKAEERVIEDLKKTGKPFVILLNSTNPSSQEAVALAGSLTDKYGVKVITDNALEMTEQGISQILESLLNEFPIKTLDVKLPKWAQVLPYGNPVVSEIIAKVKEISSFISKMKHYKVVEDAVLELDSVKAVKNVVADLGTGRAVYEIELKDGLFYDMLSSLSGDDIPNEFELMRYVKELAVAKRHYQKLKGAIEEADELGYGVVIPKECDMVLGEPEVIKQGSRYGVKIKATTSCTHLMQIGLSAEVSPISGTEKQCKDFCEFIKEEYDKNPEKVWKTNVFGRELSSLVAEEIAQKVYSMKPETKNKMRKTVTRIVNEGKGGVICILL
ncbi:MAG: stage IV sporulation protein A [Clostridia bacterium]|nr:stage IV sporulation protein A [Clostridia bacterium]